MENYFGDLFEFVKGVKPGRLTATESIFLLATSIHKGHPWEPFPFYVPTTKLDKIKWFLIRLRWKLIKRFVRYKTFLNGRSVNK